MLCFVVQYVANDFETSAMKVRVVKATGLSATETALWRDIQERNPALGSPYFCPQFTQAVARVRDDTYVAILEEEGRTSGFFPFQLRAKRVGKPIGWPLSDYHGIIADADCQWDGGELIRGCELDVYDFDHMLASQGTFAPFHIVTAESPYLDLRLGYDAYAATRQRAGTKVVNARMETKRRKLERELGPLRFVVHDCEQSAFEALLRWKKAQYRRTKAIDLFSWDWPVGLLDAIRGIQEANFAGLLSSLYAGETLVATHLGMRSHSVWHYWFPAYASEYHKYSPGYFLILEMARNAEALGLKAIDLGRGNTSYKQRLGSASTAVAQGYVGQPSLARVTRDLWQSLGGCLNRLPSHFAWDLPRRAYRRIEARNRTP